MAALSRPKTANYEVHENVVIDTLDREDHTYCGIMFPIKAKEDLPVCKIIINSIAVRGDLGPMSVWITKKGVCNGDNHNFRCVTGGSGVVDVDGNHNNDNSRHQKQSSLYQYHNSNDVKNHWTQIYSQTHQPSHRTYKKLDLTNTNDAGGEAIVLSPGETRIVYIHSRQRNDRAIVYDNSNNRSIYNSSNATTTQPRYEDSFVSVHTGKAHLSNEPFGTDSLWGWNGSPWRNNREFVGKIQYGVIYQLWQPELHNVFCDSFQSATMTMFMCQRRWESNISKLPDECVFYILNMCKYDWFRNTNANSNTSSNKNIAVSKTITIEQQKQQQENRKKKKLAKSFILQKSKKLEQSNDKETTRLPHWQPNQEENHQQQKKEQPSIKERGQQIQQLRRRMLFKFRKIRKVFSGKKKEQTQK